MSNPKQVDRSRMLPRLAVPGATALAALAVWVVARLIRGVDVMSPGYGTSMPAQTIELIWIIVVPVVVALAGWGLLVLLEHLAPAQAARIWTVIALIVLLASLAVPITGTGIIVADRVTLACLHVAVGLVLIVGLTRRVHPSPRRSAGRGARG